MVRGLVGDHIKELLFLTLGHAVNIKIDLNRGSAVKESVCCLLIGQTIGNRHHRILERKVLPTRIPLDLALYLFRETPV